MTSEKKQHGGARKGSGRPTKGERKPICMKIPMQDNERLENLVKKTKKTKVQIFIEALADYEKKMM